jgi:hypothetical protein
MTKENIARMAAVILKYFRDTLDDNNNVGLIELDRAYQIAIADWRKEQERWINEMAWDHDDDEIKIERLKRKVDNIEKAAVRSGITDCETLTAHITERLSGDERELFRRHVDRAVFRIYIRLFEKAHGRPPNPPAEALRWLRSPAGQAVIAKLVQAIECGADLDSVRGRP